MLPLAINMQNTPGQEKFVERVEKAVMQYIIVSKAAQGEVTKENLQQTFRGNLQNMSRHFDSCLKTLVQDGHLRESGNKYTATDDGREDVQKLQSIVLEIPNVVSQGGQQQRPSIPQGAGGSQQSFGSSPSTQGSQGGSQQRR